MGATSTNRTWCTFSCNDSFIGWSEINQNRYRIRHVQKINLHKTINILVCFQPLWGKYCDGGHFCSAPKECCTLGCCYHPPQTSRMFNLLFLGHWYFWAIVTVAIVCLLCFCSLWRRCRILFHILCCFMSNRDERASEPDSTGSFYAPPHYSRCNSFHHAPPPYTEVIKIIFI